MMSGRFVGFIYVLLAFSVSHATGAELSISRQVSFELPRAPLTRFQKKRLPAGVQNPGQGLMTATIRIPEGLKNSPAVVVIHTCHDRDFYDPWIERLNDWGYVTLSFSRCQPPDFTPDDSTVPSLDWKRGALAAVGALQFLAARPEVDSGRIGLIAWSRLGMIPLSIMNDEGFNQFFTTRFAAAVALYPFCSFARGPHAGPILVLVAEKDDWVDTGVCMRMSAETSNDRYPVRIKVLANAYHGFDIEGFGEARMVPSQIINPDKFAAGPGTLGYNKNAAKIAVTEIKQFFARHLNPAP